MAQRNGIISIITPVYNGEKFIEGCLQNVISQNCPFVQHVIVDGGSSDRTPEILEKYGREYSHIVWISEKDQGQSDAMNKGVQLAAGEILGFLNVDDYYEPGALLEVCQHMKGLAEPALLVGNCHVWDDNGRLSFVSRPTKIGLTNLLLGKFHDAFPMNSSAYFYHKSLHKVIGLYDTDEHYAMDVHFIFKAVQKAKVVYVDRVWGNYRYLEGTKTFEDDRSGGNAVRVDRIMKHYRMQQPFYYKFYIDILLGVSFIAQRFFVRKGSEHV